MNIVEDIKEIKDKAQYIDLTVLYENPEAYYNEIVEIIHIIKSMEQPTPIDFNDLKNKVNQA